MPPIFSTVNYKYPITGTVAPTVSEARGVNTQVVEVGFTDASTSADINHNWQMSAADLAFFFPTVSLYLEQSGTGGPVLATVVVTLINSVTVTLKKADTSAGSAQTLVAVLQRPHSLYR